MKNKSVKIEQLFKNNTPFFLIDELKLEKTADDFVSAFKNVYKNTKVCYSLKTNYLPWVAKKLYSLNIMPEVISGFELDICKLIGIKEPIIVNGPCKSIDELLYAIKNNYFIHVDNTNELDRILFITEQYNLDAKVAIRLRPPGDSWKRFGIEYQSDSWDYFIKKIKSKNKLKLVGIHIHIGTGIIELEKYKNAAEFVLEILNNIELPLEYIDMGGGFATKSARLNNYKREEWIVPENTEYASNIFNILSPYLLRNNCQLIYEPGRALIDESVDIFSKILSVSDGRVIIDAGKNIIPSIQFRDHPIELIHLNKRKEIKNNYDIFGPLCMGSDCIGRNIELNNPKENDIIRIKSVGAYCQSQSMNFIKYQPETFIEDPKGEIILIRKKQYLNNLFSLDIF